MKGKAAITFCLGLLILQAVATHAQETSYTLKEGETLYGISRKAQIPVDILKAFNKIEDPSKLKPGTVIKVPSLYTVRKGDTLFSIAKACQVPLRDLLEMNALTEKSVIKPGDRLYVSGGAPLAVAEAPSSSQPAPQAAPDKTPADKTAAPKAAPAAAVAVTPGATWPHPGRREAFNGKFTGVVFYGNQGDKVVSAGDGEVKWVGPYWGFGKTVVIKSADGTIFLYAGNEELLVNVGDRVGTGTEIARLGVSPQDGGAKLYFSIQGSKGQFIDPEEYLSGDHA